MAVRPGRKPGLWLVEFEQSGNRVHKRFPAGITKAQAEAWEVQERRRIFDSQELGRLPQISIGDAIDVWLRENRRKNQKQANGEAKQWEPWRSRALSEVPGVVEEALSSWTSLSAKCTRATKGSKNGAHVLPSTINRRLALLKAVCKHAWARNLVRENYSARIKLLKEDNRKEVYLTKAQVSSLAKASTSTEIASAIWVLAYSGLRASELLALGPHTSRAATLTVATSKSGKPRQVPIAEPIRRYLSALPLSLSYWQLQAGFDDARKRAGLPKGITLHTLRHTCASWLINAGVDLYTVGRILGHSSPLTTARYAHLADESLKRAVGKLK